ncbi:ABC transporter ATP-binding protein [Candidatus Spongiihabitans sp.]|uniref:ABC transporter ATP-binding protein n=1 Tax=Candidatus Spongiihabitans sp. TaxID=3101308 RepID=UPI003C700B13
MTYSGIVKPMDGGHSIGSPFALELINVGKVFGSLVALEGVSFSIRSGERRAVLGANGAGKTTLFNAITGDFPPTEGRIIFFGKDITYMPVHDRIRRGLRRTYQKSLLFGGLSVLDNLYLAVRGIMGDRFVMKRPGKDNAVMRKAGELAQFVGLDNTNQLVGNLSHGQQRQLEIGMAMAGSPRTILLDEPAAGLSPAERTRLVEMLHRLPDHITMVIIEHDLDVALKVSDQVTIMNDGRLFREGSPEKIQNDPDVQAIYLGAEHQ